MMKMITNRSNRMAESDLSKERKLSIIERKMKHQEDEFEEAKRIRIEERDEARLIRQEERDERIRRDAHSLAMRQSSASSSSASYSDFMDDL